MSQVHIRTLPRNNKRDIHVDRAGVKVDKGDTIVFKNDLLPKSDLELEFFSINDLQKGTPLQQFCADMGAADTVFLIEHNETYPGQSEPGAKACVTTTDGEFAYTVTANQNYNDLDPIIIIDDLQVSFSVVAMAAIGIGFLAALALAYRLGRAESRRGH